MKRSLSIAALLLASCTDDDTATVDETEAVRVQVTSDVFEPATVTIRAGQTVRWIWRGGSHNVVSGSNCTEDGFFKSGEPIAGGTFEHRFETAGTFPYYCRPHCRGGMTGTIIVQ